MNTSEMLFKRIKKTIRKREFWFTIILYPTISASYLYAKNSKWLNELIHKVGIWYFVVALIIFLYIIFYVTFEVIEKRLMHKVQGDKLKIKQEQNRK